MPKIFGNESAEVVIFTTGIMLQHCLDAKAQLENQGYSTTVLHFPYLNYLSIESLDSYIGSAHIRLCVEEHVPRGGLFTQILHELISAGRPLTSLYQLALPASFSHNYGSQMDHLESNGLTAPKVVTKIKDLVSGSSKSNRMRI